MEDEASSDDVMLCSFCLFGICLFKRFREVFLFLVKIRSRDVVEDIFLGKVPKLSFFVCDFHPRSLEANMGFFLVLVVKIAMITTTAFYVLEGFC